MSFTYPTLPRPVLYALVGATLGAALVWYGPPGTDVAAHLYQRAFFLRDGFALWNNYWYAGRYSFVTYSLFYYPLAALAGINLLATASVAVGAFAFGTLVEREWGGSTRRTAWLFAVVLAASVLSGAFPYMLGVALALLALTAVQARRFRLFGLLVIVTFCVSPLAFLLLLVVLAAALISSRHLPARAALPVVATCVGGAALWRLFPGNGRFPYSFWELLAALAFCGGGVAFTWRVERARLLFNLFIVYAGVCVICYLIPSDVGANIVRLRFIALPITVLALSLRGWKPLLPALVAVALALSWNVVPLISSYARSSDDPSSVASYWTPAIDYLHHHLGPSYRVEAVDTVDHWEADYLPAARIPLVRGWYRQDDFPENAILYHPLRPAAYLGWLHRMAVGYVVLTDAPPDYSAQAESKLLRSGRSGLKVVYRTRHITIFAVPSPTSIVTGPHRPRVLSLGSSSVVLYLPRPGLYHVALRYTPYWTAPGVCVAATPGGLISVRNKHAGVVKLSFSLTASGALAALDGSQSSCDAASKTGKAADSST